VAIFDNISSFLDLQFGHLVPTTLYIKSTFMFVLNP